MSDDWIDPATGEFLDVPRWEAKVYTCYGCADIARVSEHVKGRGQTVGLARFDPDAEVDDTAEEVWD